MLKHSVHFFLARLLITKGNTIALAARRLPRVQILEDGAEFRDGNRVVGHFIFHGEDAVEYRRHQIEVQQPPVTYVNKYNKQK